MLDRAEDLIRKAQALRGSLDEISAIQSHLAQHACLLTCAAMEITLIDALSAYAGRVGDQRLREFVRESLTRGRNPTPEYIFETLSRFDRDWRKQLEAFAQGHIRLDAIRSIVSNRNRIAHGESVSMSFVSLQQWIPSARRLCSEIERMLG